MAIINRETGTVRLVKGMATVRYRLNNPTPVVRNNIDLIVDSPMNLQSRAIIAAGGGLVMPSRPAPSINATVGFIATIPTHNNVGELGKVQRITGTLTSNALDDCKGIIKQTIMVRNVTTQAVTPFVRSSPVTTIKDGVWSHSFPMTVDTGGSPSSGNQINLMKVSYTFTITELPTWSSDHLAFTAPPYVPPAETFTMTNAYLANGSTVSFTVRSDKANSNTTVTYRLFENSTVGPTNHKRTGTLKLTNGSGVITYNILTPKPTGAPSNVICLVEEPNTARSEISIPKWVEPPYVPPPVYVPWKPSVSLSWGISKATTPSGSTNITITYNNSDGRPESRSFYLSSFLYHSTQGNTMGECSFSPDVFVLSPGQSKVVKLTWTRNNLMLHRKVGTLMPFIQHKAIGGSQNSHEFIDIKPHTMLEVDYP